MSSMIVSESTTSVAKGLTIDHYDGCNHTIFTIPVQSKSEEADAITDITVSNDKKYLALITSVSKQLIVYNLPLSEKCKHFVLPRSASKIRFSPSNYEILVADKSGDALIYNINNEDTGTKLLGHLSLLLDVLQTDDQKYIITCDRDEKIKVSCYPNTYNIQTYCLGHKEFVNHLELLPHNKNILTSVSGDGYVKFWDYISGKLYYNIYTFLDINDDQLKNEFNKIMDSEGIEVNALPITNYTVTMLSANSSLLAVQVHTYNKLLIYNVEIINDKFSHKLIEKLNIEKFTSAIQFHNLFLYVYDDKDCIVNIFAICHDQGNVSLKLHKKIKMFENTTFDSNAEQNNFESIKVLYKRRYDNVQEYQERKRQRLEKDKSSKI